MAMLGITDDILRRIKDKGLVYDCSECGEDFTGGLYDTKRHIGSVHLTIRQAPYACYVCSKSFGQMACLRRHIKQPAHDEQVRRLSTSTSGLDPIEEQCRLKTPTHTGGWSQVDKSTYQHLLVPRSKEESEREWRMRLTRKAMFAEKSSQARHLVTQRERR